MRQTGRPVETIVIQATGGTRKSIGEGRAFVAEQGNAPDGDGWEVILGGDVDGRREVVLPFH